MNKPTSSVFNGISYHHKIYMANTTLHREMCLHENLKKCLFWVTHIFHSKDMSTFVNSYWEHEKTKKTRKKNTHAKIMNRSNIFVFQEGCSKRMNLFVFFMFRNREIWIIFVYLFYWHKQNESYCYTHFHLSFRKQCSSTY
jgi:hypothetical protein